MDMEGVALKKKMTGKMMMAAAALAVFAVAFFATPEKVKADASISGQTAASNIVNLSGANSTLRVTDNATLDMDADLTFQFLSIADGKQLTIRGSRALTIDNSEDGHPCLSEQAILKIEGGTLQLKGSAAGGYLNVKTLNIEGGRVESLNSSAGISADDIMISGGTVYLVCPVTAIEARNRLTITGGNVEARTTTNGPGMYSGGTVDISGRPSVTGVGSAGEVGIRAAAEITMGDGAVMGTTTTSENDPIVEPGPEPVDPGQNENNAAAAADQASEEVPDHGRSSGNDAHKSNPLVLTTFGTITGLPSGAFLARDEQGPIAKAVFAAAMPKGFKHGFYFNLITNGKAKHTLKNGSFTMNIPGDLQKSGRTFALLALDKKGKAIIIPNTSKDPTKITAVLSFEGYAFDLIYKD